MHSNISGQVIDCMLSDLKIHKSKAWALRHATGTDGGEFFAGGRECPKDARVCWGSQRSAGHGEKG